MSHRKKSRNEPFLIIPIRTIESKQFINLSYHARLVYFALLTNWRRIPGEEHKPFNISYSRIRELTNFSYSSIKESLEELGIAEFITINHGRLTYEPNTYTVNLQYLILKDKDAHKEPVPGGNNN